MAILEGVDLDGLAHIAQHGIKERHRLRAQQLVYGARQRAADALASSLAVKEQVMEARGLSKVQAQVAVLSFQGMDVAKLQALAEGRWLPSSTDSVMSEARDATDPGAKT